MIEALDVATMSQAALDLKDPSLLLLRVSMQRPAAVPPSPSSVLLHPDVGEPLRSPPPGVASDAVKLELNLENAIRRGDPKPLTTAPRPAGTSSTTGPRRLAWAVSAAAALVGLVLIVVTTMRQQRTMVIAGPARSEQAIAAEKRLAANDAAGAASILEQRLAEPGGADDAVAQLLLGHARFRLERDADALAAYETALGLAPALAADPSMRTNLTAMVGNKEHTKLALQALELVYAKLGPLGHPLIVENASRGKAPAVRKRAREMAEERALTGDVDLVNSYSLDLGQGASCKERRETIPRLRALRDKRAVAALKKARDRRGGFLNLADVNDCLERDAQEAVDFLQALP
jgi:hypothetical protein